MGYQIELTKTRNYNVLIYKKYVNVLITVFV